MGGTGIPVVMVVVRESRACLSSVRSLLSHFCRLDIVCDLHFPSSLTFLSHRPAIVLICDKVRRTPGPRGTISWAHQMPWTHTEWDMSVRGMRVLAALHNPKPCWT